MSSAAIPLSQVASQLSKHERIGYIPVNLDLARRPRPKDEAKAVFDAADKPATRRRDEGASAATSARNSRNRRVREQRGRRPGMAAIMVLTLTFGTAVAMGTADHHGDHRPGSRHYRSSRCSATPPSTDRRPDARDDDRPRGRHRLRAVHRHPTPRAPARRDGYRGVHRPFGGDLRRRRGVRRHHCDRRAPRAGSAASRS